MITAMNKFVEDFSSFAQTVQEVRGVYGFIAMVIVHRGRYPDRVVMMPRSDPLFEKVANDAKQAICRR